MAGAEDSGWASVANSIYRSWSRLASSDVVQAHPAVSMLTINISTALFSSPALVLSAMQGPTIYPTVEASLIVAH